MTITSVITGDIVNSRLDKSGSWLKALKEALKRYGDEPLNWEIYRGDSFQLELAPAEALEAVLYIKACIKQYIELDARMAIGVGEKTRNTPKITEANGSAFINSGKCFEALNKHTLGFCSPWPELDEEINLNLTLASLAIDHWSRNASRIIKVAMEHPELTQNQLAKKLDKTQSTISESLSRAGYDEMMQLETRYRHLITNR